ncbi:hypothetical protein Csa_008714 [Cucumis sativus]|uniref:Replication factor A C-terminal domain-containing protein n=1 Tax=Cucumis sativus TaxID=3659 RepID=A0A0A0KP46_CUCSA|nr:hypothetical protein Csa_008714 [Cucumis sativus]
MLRLTISDGDDKTYITIFDASKYLIGCSVTEYYKDLQVYKKEKSKLYQNLVLCEDKKYCFFGKNG